MTVYHLVDLIFENSGVDRKKYLAAERALAPYCDLAIASSSAISDHLRSQGFRRVILRTNVADLDVFHSGGTAYDPSARKRIMYAGSLSPQKIDFDLIDMLVTKLGGRADLVLIGPRELSLETAKIRATFAREGVLYLGTLPITEVAHQGMSAAVGLIPYRLTPLSEGITPLKLYEYLAMGIPVVSTPLASLRIIPSALWIEPNSHAFVNRVECLLGERTQSTDAIRQALALDNGWKARGSELREILGQLLLG